jgi:HSP20 family protein
MHYNQSCGYGSQYRSGCGSWSRRYGGGNAPHHKYFRSVPVNIEEKEDSFELTLFAPLLVRENIKVSAKDDVLTVSYQSPEQAEEKTGNYTRREYNFQSFERSFLLNDKIQVDKIKATYSEGVLKVILPKNPESNKPSQQIPVS